MSKIIMRCSVCGNAGLFDRVPYDPPIAVVRVTNECNICDAASGGFEESWYFDREGNEVTVEQMDSAL